MLFINAPIEPIENRYSTQWAHWFNSYLAELVENFSAVPNSIGEKRVIFKYVTVQGEISQVGNLDPTLFLDPCATNVWKSSQMANILRTIQQHVNLGEKHFIVFFHDLWSPGMEQLKYYQMMTGINIDIYGVFHAGTWDDQDLTYKKGLLPIFRSSETTWINCATKIFVATEFHKGLLIRSFGSIKDPELNKKFVVIGLPFYQYDVLPNYPDPVALDDLLFKTEKNENWIAFPHRLCEEKGSDVFPHVLSSLKEANPNIEIKITHELAKNKRQFYELLAQCRYSLSLAKQETFGISMMESTLCRCIPMVPNCLSYKELYAKVFRYTPDNGAALAVKNMYKGLATAETRNVVNELLVLNIRKFVTLGESALDKMFFEMLAE